MRTLITVVIAFFLSNYMITIDRMVYDKSIEHIRRKSGSTMKRNAYKEYKANRNIKINRFSSRQTVQFIPYGTLKVNVEPINDLTISDTARKARINEKTIYQHVIEDF